MPTPEFYAWMSYYAVEPWGMADRLIGAWGKKPVEEQTASWEQMQAHVSRALGVKRGTPESP